MITIDQGKIDAPDFPRSQEWWTRFLPGWVTGAVQPDGTVTIEPSGEAQPGQDRRRAADVRRRRELALMAWLQRLPQLEPAIVEDAGERCQCWRYPVRLHDGHCCFTGSPARICHSMPEDMRRAGEEIPA
jgi:hypothetical protein